MARARPRTGSRLPAAPSCRPRASRIGTRENVLLAVAPAFLHVLQRDVGGHRGGQCADGGGDSSRRRRDRRASGRRPPAAGRGRSRWSSSCNSDSSNSSSSRGMARPSTSRTRPSTRARPPPRSSMRRVITSKVRHAAAVDVQAQQGRIEIGAQGVDVVEQQVLAAAAAAQAVAASTPLRSRLGISYQWPTGCRHCSGRLSV